MYASGEAPLVHFAKAPRPLSALRENCFVVSEVDARPSGTLRACDIFDGAYASLGIGMPPP